MIFKIIIWTIISTIWVAGGIGCAFCGLFYAMNVDNTDSESEATKYLKLAAAWWTGCIAIVASMIVTCIVWLAS